MNNSYCVIILFSENINDEYKSSMFRKTINFYGFDILIDNHEGTVLAIKSHNNILKTIYKFVNDIEEHKKYIKECKIFPMGDVSTFTFPKSPEEICCV